MELPVSPRPFSPFFLPGMLRDVLFARAGHRGPASDHFDGGHFRNQIADERSRLRDFLRWRRERRDNPSKTWPRMECPPAPPPLRQVGGQALRATLVGHSTVLLQLPGAAILTDPHWCEWAGPAAGLGVARCRPPAIRLADLPKIDAVLVSHNHYDHLDLPTLRALARGHAPRFFTGLGNRAFLEGHGVGPATELDWWQEAEMPGGLRLTAVPARHFSARGIRDRNRTLWCGFAVQTPAGNIYFAGDTGDGGHFAEIARRVAPLRLALLPIGAYLPRWFMAPVHLSPAEAIRAHGTLGARTSLAIHFGTFPLADDGPGQAEAEFAAAAAEAGDPARGFRLPDFGAAIDVP